MKEEAKYYTPTIEEFRVGFEYEWSDNFPRKIKNWRKALLNERIYSLVIEEYKKNNQLIRVKYLDKEDIESLGWEMVLDIGGLISACKTINNKKIMILTGRNTTTIGYRDNQLFNGKAIKNKSELKILFKQLGIKCL